MMEGNAYNSKKNLSDAVNNLISKLEELKRENIKLKDKLTEATDKLNQMQIENIEIKNNYERLKLAKAFGLSESSKKQAYIRISRLVRDIDTCIALLKK